jgi:hypothetical protein
VSCSLSADPTAPHKYWQTGSNNSKDSER